MSKPHVLQRLAGLLTLLAVVPFTPTLARAQTTTNFYTWGQPGAGSWENASGGNWLFNGLSLSGGNYPSLAPNAVVVATSGTTATDVWVDFSQQDIAGENSVTLTAARTVSGLLFGDMDTTTPGNWTISGAAITINSNTTLGSIYTGVSTQTVTLNNGLTGSMMKSGLGTLVVSGSSAGTTAIVMQGTLITNAVHSVPTFLGRNATLQFNAAANAPSQGVLAGTVLTTGVAYMSFGNMFLSGATFTASGAGTAGIGNYSLNADAVVSVAGSTPSTFATGTLISIVNNASPTAFNVFARPGGGAGLIVNGTITPAASNSNLGVSKQGRGLLQFNSAQTWLQTTAASSGLMIYDGTVQLNFASALAPTSNILVSQTVTLGGGTLLLTGKDGTTNTQTLTNLYFSGATGTNFGGVSVVLIPGQSDGSSVTLTSTGTWTRNAAGAALFVDLSFGSVSTPVTFTASPNTATANSAANNGILGYAVVKDTNGFNFATVSSGSVVGLTSALPNGYLAFPGTPGAATANYALDSGVATVLGGAVAANSLKLTPTTTAGGQLDLAGNVLTLSTGGLLFTGGNAFTITDTSGTSTGRIASGATATGTDVIIHNYGTAPLTYNIALGFGATTHTGTGRTVLTKSAPTANTGVLNLIGGTLEISSVSQLGGTAGAINAGGMLAINPTTLDVSGGATIRFATNYSAGSADLGNFTVGRTVTLYSSLTVDTNGNTITLTNGGAGSIFASSNNVTGTANGNHQGLNPTLFVTGGGNLIFNQAPANQNFSANIVVQNATLTSNAASTLQFGSPLGSGVGVNWGLQVNKGGTLVLGVSNTITNTAAIATFLNLYLTGSTTVPTDAATLRTANGTFNRMANMWLDGGTISLGAPLGTGFGSVYLGLTGTSSNLNSVVTTYGGTTFSQIISNGDSVATNTFGFTGVLNLGQNNSFDVASSATKDPSYSSDLVVSAVLVNQTSSQGTGVDGINTVNGISVSGTGNAAYGSLSKFGPGTMALLAPNKYSGSTSIYAGTLLAANTTGSATGTGIVSIYNTGTVTGTGTIAGPIRIYGGGTLKGTLTATGSVTVNGGGIVAPGNGTTQTLTFGSASVSTAVVFNPGSIYNFYIAATNAGSASTMTDGSSTAASGNNLLSILGSASTLTINTTGATATGGLNIRIASAGGFGTNWDATKNYSWTIATLSNPAGLNFTNPSNTVVDSSAFAAPGYTFGISGVFTLATNGTGDKIVLNYTPFATPPLAAGYWNGLRTDGNWFSVNAGGTTSNWQGTLNGGVAVPQGLIPTGPIIAAPIFFAGIADASSTSLGQNIRIASLNVTAQNTLPVGIINDGNTLTISTGGITIEDGSGVVTLGVRIALGGNQTWANASSSNSLMVDSQVVGSGNLTITGNATFSGALSFNGSLTTTGNTTFFGPLSFNGSMTTNGTTTLSGPLTFTGGLTVSGTTTLSGTTSFGGSLTINGVATITNPLTMGGGLTFNGPGTLVLDKANTYPGLTTVASGSIINYVNGQAFGVSGNILVPNGATVQVQGDISGGATGKTITIAGIGAAGTTGVLQNVLGNNNYAGSVVLTAAATIASDAGSLNFNGTGSTFTGAFPLTLTGAGNGSIASAINIGAGTVNKTGSGTWVLSGTSNYTGSITLTDGILGVGIAEAQAATTGPLGASTSSIIFAGGTLQYSPANTKDYSSRFALAIGRAFKVDTNGANVTWAANLNSSLGTLTKSGSGTLFLTGINGFSAGVTVNGGTLNFNSTASLGSGGITLNASTLQFAAGTNLTITNAITLNGATIDTNGGTQTVGGLTGTDLVKVGDGTLVLSAGNSYTGSTTVNAGTLAVTAGSGLGSGALIINNTNANPFPTTTSVQLLNGAQTITSITSVIANPADGNTVSLFLSSATTLTLNLTASSTFTGTIYGAGSVEVNGGAIANSLILSGTALYTGATTITSGTLRSNNALVGQGGTITIADGARLQASGVIQRPLAFSGPAKTGQVAAVGNLTIADLANPINIEGRLIVAANTNVQLTGAASGPNLIRSANLAAGSSLGSGTEIRFYNNLGGTLPGDTGVLSNSGSTTISGKVYGGVATGGSTSVVGSGTITYTGLQKGNFAYTGVGFTTANGGVSAPGFSPGNTSVAGANGTISSSNVWEFQVSSALGQTPRGWNFAPNPSQATGGNQTQILALTINVTSNNSTSNPEAMPRTKLGTVTVPGGLQINLTNLGGAYTQAQIGDSFTVIRTDATGIPTRTGYLGNDDNDANPIVETFTTTNGSIIYQGSVPTFSFLNGTPTLPADAVWAVQADSTVLRYYVAPVPEPTTVFAMGAGLLGLGRLIRRRVSLIQSK